MNDRVWITWEKQRRSIVLAASLNCKLFVLDYQGSFRYLKCIYKTIAIVRREKPSVLFVQNPSMVLACLATSILKQLFNSHVIVDRHTNFLLNSKKKISFTDIVFLCMSFISIRKADITIVTNEDLGHIVKVGGGQPFILPDKIPLLMPRGNIKRDRTSSILLISSFGSDEPIEDVWEAAGMLEHENITIYISGNHKKIPLELIKNKPDNIVLTGFLPEQEFIDLLFELDAIMVLTNHEYTLLCGCYEALAAEKPLITSDTKVLRELFEGAVFVHASPISITNGIRTALSDLKLYESKTREMKKKINFSWGKKITKLNEIINKLSN